VFLWKSAKTAKKTRFPNFPDLSEEPQDIQIGNIGTGCIFLLFWHVFCGALTFGNDAKNPKGEETAINARSWAQ